MSISLNQLTKDIEKINFDDILSCWKWLLGDLDDVVTISVLGDIFLKGNNGYIYWLQTDKGELISIANSLEQYQQFLNTEDKIDHWFLPLLVEKLEAAGKTLKKNEVYSYKKPPVLGGEYSVDNIEPTDMSVHFAISGQICEQIEKLPDKTRVNIKFEK